MEDSVAALPSAAEAPRVVTDSLFQSASDGDLQHAFDHRRWRPSVERLAREIVGARRHQPYVAVHWRRGYGFRGAPNEPNLGFLNTSEIAAIVRKLTSEDGLARRTHGFLQIPRHRLMRSDAVGANSIISAKEKLVYIATNQLSRAEKADIAARLGPGYSIYTAILDRRQSVQRAPSEILSRAEQLVCTCSLRFAGFPASTWSQTVVRMRRGKVYPAGVRNPHHRCPGAWHARDANYTFGHHEKVAHPRTGKVGSKPRYSR